MTSLLSVLMGMSAAGAQEARGVLAGIAFESESGTPLQGVQVEVGSDQVLSDPDGAFSLPLPQGTYDVRLRAQGYHPGELLAVDVAVGEVTEILVTFSPDVPPTALIQAPNLDDMPVDVPAGEPGTIRATVLDAAKKPVPGARVYVRGQAASATTDASGRFTLTLPGGVHDLSVLRNGYATASIEGFEVPSGGTAALDVTLQAAKLTLDAFQISAPFIEGSVQSLLDERKSASSVADVLGAEEMSRSGDGDAAAALRRVVGLTVVGGRYVFVRGMGDRYSSSLFNGSMLPSPEPELRVVPLDLFPSSILESVVIQKSWSPNMPGEFGGGVVQLRTIRPPTELVASVSIGGTHVVGTTLAPGFRYQGGPTDWLGISGSSRDLPESVAAASAEQRLALADPYSGDRGFESEELEAFGEAMSRTYGLQKRWLPPNQSFRASLGDGVDFGTQSRIGLVGAITYGNTWQTVDFERNYFQAPEGDGSLQLQNAYRFDRTTNEVTLGGFVTGGLEITPDQTIRYVGMLTRNSENEAREYQGFNGDLGEDIRLSRLRWVERQILYHQLLGVHDWGRLRADWRGVTAVAGRDEPDNREYRFDNEGGTSTWRLSDRPDGNLRYFSDNRERFSELGLDLTLRLGRDPDDSAGKLMLGGVYVTRNRAVDTRRYKFFHRVPNARNSALLARPIEEILIPENIGREGFSFEEFTRPTDNYTASQTIRAAYGMAEVPLTPWLRAMAGVRVEESLQQVDTFALFSADAQEVGATLDNLDVLPGASLTLAPGGSNVQVRVGYASTVTRPEFRELSPASFNEVTGGRETFGNPDLERGTIDHYDVRAEWFPSAGEVFSISGFAKELTSPIETVIINTAQQSRTWGNAERATNLGLELEFRKLLPLNLYAAGNLALIRSRIDLSNTGSVGTSRIRPLEGQSPYVINLQLGWDHPSRPDQFTLLYNVIGRRITEVGSTGSPDAYELPVHLIDFVAKKSLGEQWTLSLSLGNLLDAAARSVQGEELVDEIRRGPRVGLGLRWSP